MAFFSDINLYYGGLSIARAVTLAVLNSAGPSSSSHPPFALVAPDAPRRAAIFLKVLSRDIPPNLVTRREGISRAGADDKLHASMRKADLFCTATSLKAFAVKQLHKAAATLTFFDDAEPQTFCLSSFERSQLLPSAADNMSHRLTATTLQAHVSYWRLAYHIVEGSELRENDVFLHDIMPVLGDLPLEDVE